MMVVCLLRREPSLSGLWDVERLQLQSGLQWPGEVVEHGLVVMRLLEQLVMAAGRRYQEMTAEAALERALRRHHSAMVPIPNAAAWRALRTLAARFVSSLSFRVSQYRYQVIALSKIAMRETRVVGSLQREYALGRKWGDG